MGERMRVWAWVPSTRVRSQVWQPKPLTTGLGGGQTGGWLWPVGHHPNQNNNKLQARRQTCLRNYGRERWRASSCCLGHWMFIMHLPLMAHSERTSTCCSFSLKPIKQKVYDYNHIPVKRFTKTRHEGTLWGTGMTSIKNALHST